MRPDAARAILNHFGETSILLEILDGMPKPLEELWAVRLYEHFLFQGVIPEDWACQLPLETVEWIMERLDG